MSSNQKPEKKDKTAVDHRTVECAYCGKPYIRPCQTQTEAKACGNVKIKEK